MTLGNLFWIILFGFIVFRMMKKGGGCCGDHNHGDHKYNNPASTNNDQKNTLEHHHKEEHEHTNRLTGKDPVCGMDVSNSSPESLHGGRTFRFCSEQCRKLFNLNPNKYITH